MKRVNQCKTFRCANKRPVSLIHAYWFEQGQTQTILSSLRYAWLNSVKMADY